MAIVSDNASNMQNARMQVDDLDVFTYGCQAHMVNLVAVDLEDKHKVMSGKIVDVIQAFRNIHALSHALVEEGSPACTNKMVFCARHI